MLFSKKDLSKLILPLLLEQALAQAVGMIDTIMVAQAGAAAVSGVSLVDSVNLLILYFLGAASGGGAIVISQAIGAGRNKVTEKAKNQLIWVSFLLGVFLSVAVLLFRKGLLSLIFGSISAEIMHHAQNYFFFTALSLPFLALRNAFGAIYRSFGNTRISLYVTLVTNIVNVGGNAILIFVYHMGAAGAAISTLCARVVGAVIMLFLICDKRRKIHVEKIYYFKPDFQIIKRIFMIGIPNGFESSMFQFGKVITQSLISTFGSVAIAANAAANTFTSMLYIPGTAMGSAMTTVVGRCIGAGEKEQAKRYTRRLLGFVYGIILLMAVVMSIFAPQLVGTFRLTPEGSKLAVNLFLFHSICVSTIWPIAFTLPNSFRAASDVRYTMVISIVSMWIFRVGGGFFFAKFLELGVFGVWIGMACDWVFRAILFGTRFLRGRWLTKYKELR
ncbi:MAG: MATE family efflux transporter [Clostridia bacterium]|nr:MATE family efflux transporter [Clostridia bacterium]